MGNEGGWPRTSVPEVFLPRLRILLRSLAPGHPDYQAKYFGDLRAREAAPVVFEEGSRG